METAIPDEAETRDWGAHAERKLQALLAEVARHQRVKAERGHVDLEDRTLHHRVKHIVDD
jgi:hypothetical protein